jgi:hypothetical protein
MGALTKIYIYDNSVKKSFNFNFNFHTFKKVCWECGCGCFLKLFLLEKHQNIFFIFDISTSKQSKNIKKSNLYQKQVEIQWLSLYCYLLDPNLQLITCFKLKQGAALKRGFFFFFPGYTTRSTSIILLRMPRLTRQHALKKPYFKLITTMLSIADTIPGQA